jgi:hypothetical protein
MWIGCPTFVTAAVLYSTGRLREGMRGLAGFSMKINNHHLIMERDRKLRERERALQQSYQSGHEDPRPSWPLSSTEASPPVEFTANLLRCYNS